MTKVTSLRSLNLMKNKGYNVYYLSNYSHFNMSTAPEVLDFIPYMDGGIYSCDVQLLKPDMAIYELLCKKYELVPSECVFIDDRKENVEAARAFGMQVIHFKSYETADKQLQEFINL